VSCEKLIPARIRKLLLNSTHQTASYALSLLLGMNNQLSNMATCSGFAGSNGTDNVGPFPRNQYPMANELFKQAIQCLSQWRY
jgi:hypothetical protein